VPLRASRYVSGVIASVKRPIAGCLACMGALFLLALLAYEVDRFQRFDATALSRLAAYKETWLGSLARPVMHFADPLPLLGMLAAVCLMALRWGRPRHAIAAVGLVAGANLTTQFLKGVLAHPRYQPILGWYQVGTNAFPSGHATAAMSIVLAFGLVAPRRWRPMAVLLGVCLIPAVGCSVLILHRHYPSDVAGGLLVATGWLYAAVAGLRISEHLSSRQRTQIAGG
jgi:membrane-associated phospholipid phosphatase